MSRKKHFRVYLPRIIATVLITLFIFGVVTAIRGFIAEKPEKKQKKIQPITLLKPPPPPPPPPKQEPPPEPEIEEQIEEPEPEPENLPDVSDQPPAESLGLDAEGGAGSDGFGLAARKGGRGLLAGNPNAWYGGIVKQRLLEEMSDRDELRRRAYSVYLSLWLDANGRVIRYTLNRSSGDNRIDDVIRAVLDTLGSIGEAPPVGMKQPVKLKITSRM